MLRLIFLTVLPLLASRFLLSAGDTSTTYFRQHGGVLESTAPLPENFDDGATLVWSSELGSGHSTPTLVEDRIFLTTFTDDELATIALNRETGQQLWRKVCPAKTIESYHPSGSPAASTIASDGQHLYVFFGSYGLLCYDLDGELQWEKPMGPFQDEFGAASSPILVDGTIILNEDHDINSFITAINAATGETLWETDRPGFTRSYSTPVIWEVNGKKQVVVAGALVLSGYDLENGSLLWQMRGLSRIVDNTPVVANGNLFVATWSPGGDEGDRISMEPFDEALTTYDKDGDKLIGKDELSDGPVLDRFYRIDLNQNQKLDADEWQKYANVFEQAQNVAVAIRPGGRGDITDTHVIWTHRKGLPTVPSPVVHDSILYMVKDGGIVTALDASTGEVIQQVRTGVSAPYYASPIIADNKLYLASRSGVLTVFKAGPDLERLSSHDFAANITATPVADKEHIFVRTEKMIYCFTLKN
ncbi:MAG: PQQ-binding-like beta-propeller repeat protein [Planctomycetaceae bacterium]|nr:PQQ-binding-like beta-propeller repeat protein [Planctomycetaceae bacterium]